MTQIVVTLEQGANSSLLRRMIENMKGVVKASVTTIHEEKLDKEKSDWIKNMSTLSDTFDSSLIDMDDDRTRYIMSK